MAVYGAHLAFVARNSATYIGVFETCVMEELLAVFSNLEGRADAIADEEYERMGSVPADQMLYWGPSEVAEWATWKGQAFFNTMVGLRQTTLNLFSAGLLHLLEQQLAMPCRDAAFTVAPPEDTKLQVLVAWYERYFHFKLTSLSDWSLVDELRLVANTVKHGEGRSATQLRQRRPQLFQHPVARSMGLQASTDRKIRHPLSGDDLYVTAEAFQEYSHAARRFFDDIGHHFEGHRNEYYPRGS